MAKPRKNMLASLALLATLLHLSPLNSTAQSEIPDDRVPLYVFGDSMYDTGMALHINRGSAAMFWPYGMSYFKRPAGRFSDGRLIPDFIAQYMNLSFPKPFVLPGLDDYTGAVNFADTGAGVLDDAHPDRLNMKWQVEYYMEMVKQMEHKLGKEKTKKLLSRAIHLINIAGNDYADLFSSNSEPPSLSSTRLYVSNVLGNLSTFITTIYNQGGRKFAYQNLGPTGCMPGIFLPDGSCRVETTDISKMHNDGFANMAEKLQSQLPEFKYSIYDFSTSLAARLNNGSSYGFKENKSACCGSGPFNGERTCQLKGLFTVCNNPSDYLWFDSGHPTEKAYEQFAQEFWSGSYDVVAPYNIKSLFEMQ